MLPPALRFQVDASGHPTEEPAEPIAADLRPEADGKDNAKLKLIAGLLGVPFNDLRHRELIAARRRRHVRQGIGATIALLGGLAWLMYLQSEKLWAKLIYDAASGVASAVGAADQQGNPRTSIGSRLEEADKSFTGIDSTLLWLPGRDAVLRGQKAVKVLVDADHHGITGETEQQRKAAEQARTMLEDVVKEEPSDPEWRRQLALSHDLIAGALATEWQVDLALAEYRKALQIREGLASDYPRDIRQRREIALSHTNVGDMLRRQGKWKLALEDYCAALKIEAHLAAAVLVPELKPYCGELIGDELTVPQPDLQLERDLLIGNQRVGDMLLKESAYEAAEAAYREAVAIAERLDKDQPKNVQAQRDLAVSRSMLGDALQRQGKSEAARIAYNLSLETAQSLAAVDPTNVALQRDLYKSHEAIGILLFEQGALDAAREAFKAALDIAEPLAADQANGLAQRELSVLRNRRAEVFEAGGDLKAALTDYRQALYVRRKLAKADPTNAQAQRDLSLSHERVGDVLRKQGRWPEALDAYKASLAIAQLLADGEPDNRQWQRELSIAYHNFARVLDAEGQPDAALEAYEAALEVVEGLVRDEPSDVEAQRTLLARYSNLGEFQERNGSRAEAQRSYCQAGTVIQTLINLEPQSGTWRERLTWIEQRLQATHEAVPARC
jgi:tetratricopeptide (TPR) repeat protein